VVPFEKNTRCGHQNLKAQMQPYNTNLSYDYKAGQNSRVNSNHAPSITIITMAQKLDHTSLHVQGPPAKL
jgi:hypothetical protein